MNEQTPHMTVRTGKKPDHQAQATTRRKWNTFIQWKGTTVCMDVYCPDCDGHGYIHDGSASAVRCPYCGAIWELGSEVTLTRINQAAHLYPLEIRDLQADRRGPR